MLRLLPLFLLCTAAQVFAQQPPAVGVVYAPARTYEAVASDFRQMQAAGVRVVRMPPVADDRLLTLADTLGLALYQELPSAYLTAARARTDTDAMEAALTDVLTRSRGHRSAQTFGLARRPDTGDARVCRVLESLAERVRTQLPRARTYYVAPFASGDRCVDAVDFVLLPALDAPDPARVLARWQAAHPSTPAGLIVGWRVQADMRGTQNAHSPENVAARLDTALTRLLRAPAEQAPTALLVYRWRDAGPAATDLQAVAGPSFGVLERDGVRPAYDVLRGHFTGTRNVFALRSGAQVPHRHRGSLVVLTWLMVGLLGWVMRREPRVRQMATRYFTAHGFYRESIRDGRDALGLSVLVLALATGLSAGIIAAVLLDAAQSSPAFGFLVSALPVGVGRVVARLLASPVLLALSAMLAFLVAQVVQALVFAVAVRRRYALKPVQPLSLSLWSHWPLLPLAFAALVVDTLPPPQGLRGMGIVVALALAVEVWALLRTLSDLKSLTRIPVYLAGALLLAHPLVLGAVAVVVSSLDYGSAYAFFVNLARHGL